MSSTRFNPLVPALEEVVGTRGQTRPDTDGGVLPGENDFSSSKNKPTLRSYISSLTKGAVPTENVTEYNGPVPDHGNAYPLGKDGEADSTFTQLGIEGARSNALQDYSNSGLFDSSGRGLQGIVNKGTPGHANGEDPLSGHMLLQGVDDQTFNIGGDPPGKTDGATAYQQAIPDILNNVGHTSPSHPTTEVNGRGTGHTSSRFKTLPITGDLSNSSNDTGRVSVENLSKAAIDIMLRATGKLRGPDGYGKTGLEAGVNTSTVQAGTSRIDTESLRVGNYAEISGLNPTMSGENTPLPTSDGLGDDRYSNKSYGVTYNPLEPFESFTSGVTTFALLAGGALAGVLSVGGLLSTFTKANSNIPTSAKLLKSDAPQLEPGRFRFSQGTSALTDILNTAGVETNVAKLLNIYAPVNSAGGYGQCVILGFASMIGISYKDFSIDSNNNLAMTSLDVLKLSGKIAERFIAIVLTEEKGYYTNIFREIMKEAGALVTNVTADPTSLLSANGIAGIANAKIVRFIDTLARIGDVVLLQAISAENKGSAARANPNDVYDLAGFSNLGFQLRGNEFKGFATRRIYGDKLSNKRGGTVGIADMPSAHLIPDSYKDLLSSSIIGKRMSGFKAVSTSGRTNLRLKQEDVQRVEEALDAEYMPFYFHDLRTNEIVSFHAFLDDLSDSYTANYNASSGYGRIEDIQTYKDTKRSVGCTFHIVGMNPEDFQYMWYQINKLTTMVYPQWSQGRSLSTTLSNGGDFKFSQPFSQIPTATPVIRFRVGDLIRSNYSRFNLKRLFGYKDADKSQTTAQAKVTQYYLPVGEYTLDSDPDKTVKINKEIILGTTEPILTGNESVTTGYLVDISRPGENIATIKYGTAISEEPVTTIRFYLHDYKPRTLHDVIAANQNAELFYKVDDNSVIKSFESASGMGLAAVVTQLSFTWMDAQWGAGEDGPGNRAPRSCKVQMSFSPIHDIAPGLDHEGFNRAPIYPVGDLVNSIVESDEDNPYGPGTKQRNTLRSDIDEASSAYLKGIK